MSDKSTAIENLRQAYPALMTVAEYCKATGRSIPSIYSEFKRNPDLSVKQGRSRRIFRDVWLASLEAGG